MSGDTMSEAARVPSPFECRRMTRRAQVLATVAHYGQVDKVGQPYIEHPRRVAEAVSEVVGDGPAVEVAFLHDVVEDTVITLEDLRDLGFSYDVIAAVDALSKRKGEKFAAYYERVKANPLALVVKWHDVADNADPARLALVAPDTRERLRTKYERARALLSTAGLYSNSEIERPLVPPMGSGDR